MSGPESQRVLGPSVRGKDDKKGDRLFVNSASLPVKIEKILVPIDFSEHSERTLRFSVRLAEMTKAGLILFHVFELPEYARAPTEGYSLNYGEQKQFEMAIDLIGKRLHRLAGAIGGPGFEVTTSSCMGTPYEQIIKLAKDRDIDLIVIGSHGYVGLTHLFLGSTAERVVGLASCPVVVVP
jgi:universal stress protein A